MWNFFSAIDFEEGRQAVATVVWAGSSRFQCRADRRAGMFAGTADVRTDRFRVLKTLHDCLLCLFFLANDQQNLQI